MKDSNISSNTNPINEARRYVKNAKETLQDNGKLNAETGRYEDVKYVRAAGNYLWLGVLLALGAAFPIKKKGNKRLDVKDYTTAIAQRDYKLLDWVVNGYNIMHLSMTYDGIQIKKICDEGFAYANYIIDRCEVLTQRYRTTG